MKFKLDENLPESLLVTLLELKHDVDNVRQEGLGGQIDPNIWQAAQEEGRFSLRKTSIFPISGSLPQEPIMV